MTNKPFNPDLLKRLTKAIRLAAGVDSIIHNRKENTVTVLRAEYPRRLTHVDFRNQISRILLVLDQRGDKLADHVTIIDSGVENDPTFKYQDPDWVNRRWWVRIVAK